jgi:hypothetical protein
MANYYCEEGCGDASLVGCPIREAGECPSKPSAERVAAARERIAYMKGWKDRGTAEAKNAGAECVTARQLSIKKLAQIGEN